MKKIIAYDEIHRFILPTNYSLKVLPEALMKCKLTEAKSQSSQKNEFISFSSFY